MTPSIFFNIIYIYSSFQVDPSTIASCSIDTTCTIWDIVQMMPKTQLIAHDKEVFDIAFACGKDIFGNM